MTVPTTTVPTKLKSEFVEKRRFYGCVLGEADLRALADLIAEPPVSEIAVSFSISVDLPGRNFRATTVDDLIHDGLPERFSNLTMSLYSSEKRIYLNIDWYTSLSVTGADQQWVFGKQEILSRFLLTKRRRYGAVYAFVFSKWGSVIGLGVLVLSLVAVVLVNKHAPAWLTFRLRQVREHGMVAGSRVGRMNRVVPVG